MAESPALFSAPDCVGGFRCPADKHLHGCLNDNGNCDRPEEHKQALFPDGCTCGHYGKGLTMTRVHMETCPVHGEAPRPDEHKVCCIKHGPMVDMRAGQRWCDCPSPRMVNCARDKVRAE